MNDRAHYWTFAEALYDHPQHQSHTVCHIHNNTHYCKVHIQYIMTVLDIWYPLRGTARDNISDINI